MTTPATTSSLAQALTAEALTRARRRLLTGHPDPTRANAPTSASLTVDQLRVLADAALLDLDRYATGQGLRYSRVGTTLMLAAPTEQRLTDAIDTIAAAAINTGARGNTPGLGDEHPAARARFRQSHRVRQQRRLTRAWGSSHHRARPRTHRRRNVAQGARHRQLWRV